MIRDHWPYWAILGIVGLLMYMLHTSIVEEKQACEAKGGKLLKHSMYLICVKKEVVLL